MSFEWENGRILKNINTSDKAVQMSYDSNGMRTQKSVDGVKTNYYYDSNKNLIALVKGNDTLLFYYDSDGSATSFSYNGTMYFYVKINIKWLSYAVDAILWLIPALYAVSKIWKSVSKTASKLVSFGKKLISVGKTLFKRLDNRLYCAFAKESTYRIVKTIGKLAGIISIISSPGSIVQYLIDILDGKWDG